MTSVVACFEGMNNTFILNLFSSHACPNRLTDSRASEASDNGDMFDLRGLAVTKLLEFWNDILCKVT